MSHRKRKHAGGDGDDVVVDGLGLDHGEEDAEEDAEALEEEVGVLHEEENEDNANGGNAHKASLVVEVEGADADEGSLAQ